VETAWLCDVRLQNFRHCLYLIGGPAVDARVVMLNRAADYRGQFGPYKFCINLLASLNDFHVQIITQTQILTALSEKDVRRIGFYFRWGSLQTLELILRTPLRGRGREGNWEKMEGKERKMDERAEEGELGNVDCDGRLKHGRWPSERKL